MSGAPAPTPIGAVDGVAYSRQFRTWKPKGRCANHVASCYTKGLTLGSFGIVSAIDAWNKATQRETSTTPPLGAPVYWESGQWGHIAISVGGGRVRSTDYPVNEQLGECTIAEMGQRWPGMRYLGWSRDMAGRPIPGLEKTKPVTPAPIEEDPMAGITLQQIIDGVWNVAWKAGDGHTYTAASWLRAANEKAGRGESYGKQALARVAALEATVQALTKNPNATPAQIQAAAKAGAEQALEEKITGAVTNLNVNPNA